MNRSIKVAAPAPEPIQPLVSLTIEEMRFGPSDWVPNHPRLPVLIYASAVTGVEAFAPVFEASFRRNGWQGVWRDGIFDYQHYHTNAHEVLGIAEGRARSLIGGPGGAEISVNAGDCLILPAGTGHRRLEASRDFLVVGAYPPGQEPDILTGPASDEQLRTIADLSLPQTDPLEGASGPLLRYWRVQH